MLWGKMILFCYSVFLSITLLSQQVFFKTYTVQDGLVSNPVRCIYQDSKGYIWIGTFEGGAVRFDGKYFTRYSSDDGLLNDRPAGVGIWTLRTPAIWTLSTRLTYNLPIPSAPGPAGGSGPQRYRASLYVSVNNLTNHANLGGFSGVMTSPFFMTPTSVQNPRKVDMGMNVSF